MEKPKSSTRGKYQKYISDIFVFCRYILSLRKLSMIPLYILGFIASTFHILAFMSCVKFVSGTMRDNAPIYGIPFEFVGVIFVFLTLLLWALGTKYYRVSLVDLEMSVSSELLGKILYRNLQASSREDVLSPGLSTKLGASARSLFVVSLNLIVVSSVFSVLILVNSHLALFLLILLSVVSIFIPGLQAKAKSHGRRYQEANTSRKKSLSNFQLMAEEFLRRDVDERVSLDISSVVNEENYWRHKMITGVENSALLLNIFATVSITGMMFWYLNFEGPLNSDLIAELAIFLILLRFTVSYAGNLFRQLLQVNSNYRDISLLGELTKRQPRELMPATEKDTGVIDLAIDSTGPKAVLRALDSLGPIGALVSYSGSKQVVKLKVPLQDLQNEFSKSPLEETDYSFEDLPNTGRSKVQCINQAVITDFAVISTIVTGLLLDSDCVVIPRDVYDRTSDRTREYVEHAANRFRICLTHVDKQSVR